VTKGRSFDLSLYTESLARRAFFKNLDNSLALEDYKQIAAMSVLRARRRFRKAKKTKFETFAIHCVKNSLVTMTRRQKPSGYELMEEIATDPKDDFVFRVQSFITSCQSLSEAAQQVANGLLGIWTLPTVSLTSFRRSLRMSKLDFNRACKELRTRFHGEVV